MNEDLKMRFHEAIVKILERKPGSYSRWIRTRLVKDGIRKWFPDFNEHHLQEALQTLENDGFVYKNVIDRWFVN